MKILVPSLTPEPVALRALYAEGLDPTLCPVDDGYAYGQLVEDEWHAGEGFTIVEHDIAPWPGALGALARCSLPWCGYRYALGERGYIGGSIGCVRFSSGLIREHPDLFDGLGQTHWRNLDGVIEQRVSQVTNQRRFHEHLPAVAHVRDLTSW